MKVQISSQHISISTKLKDYINDKTIEIVTKYFHEAPSAHVYFTKTNHHFLCEIVVNEGTGRHVLLKSNASCDDMYSAYDQSLGKLQKQLRKYKSKLNDYSKKMKLSEKVAGAMDYVISSNSRTNSDDEVNVDNPAIIAEMPARLLTLSVGEAVMKMDLHNLPALVFKNAASNKINMIYYRKDGNISWVDPQ